MPLSSCDAAKNVILTGVHKVAVHDPEPVALEDLSAAFYLFESDVGQNRAEAVVPRLQELNPACKVEAHTGDITSNTLSDIQVCTRFPF